MKSKVIAFPEKVVSFHNKNHSVLQEDMAMKVKHTHPEYANEEERKNKLRELKRICVLQVTAQRLGGTA